jgi:hypothetical protein
MRAGRPDTGRADTAREQNDRLGRLRGRTGKGPAVPEVLEVERDQPRRLVGRKRLDELDRVEVGPVADPPAVLRALAEPGRDRHDRVRAGLERSLDSLLERRGRTASTTSSGASGRSSSARYDPRPSTSAPERLTRKTRRRCSPSSALRASHWPHFAGSFEAPTTATERGSKRARRSRPVPTAIAAIFALTDRSDRMRAWPSHPPQSSTVPGSPS